MLNQIDRLYRGQKSCMLFHILCMVFHDIQSIQDLQNETEPHEYQPMYPSENCSAYQKI